MSASSSRGDGIFVRFVRKFRCTSREEESSAASNATSFPQEVSRGGVSIYPSTLTGEEEVVAVARPRFRRGSSRQVVPVDTHPECLICLEIIHDGKMPIPMGCACRGDAGYGHVSCKLLAAIHSSNIHGKSWHSKFLLCVVGYRIGQGFMLEV